MRTDPLPPPQTEAQPRKRRSGFTLVEIMAVMAVIAALLSLAAMGIQSIDKGNATTTAQTVAEALFDEARSAAIGRGTRARLLIHNELNDNDEMDRTRYLGFMAVAVLDTDQQGAPTNTWRLISRGTQLPNGVYYSYEESEDASSRIGVGGPGTMSIKLPGAETVKQCYYYEFNAEGVCLDADSGTEAGAAIVLVGGSRPRDAPEATMSKTNKVGFVVWRNGRSSIFRSPEQIDGKQ